MRWGHLRTTLLVQHRARRKGHTSWRSFCPGASLRVMTQLWLHQFPPCWVPE